MAGAVLLKGRESTPCPAASLEPFCCSQDKPLLSSQAHYHPLSHQAPAVTGVIFQKPLPSTSTLQVPAEGSLLWKTSCDPRGPGGSCPGLRTTCLLPITALTTFQCEFLFPHSHPTPTRLSVLRGQKPHLSCNQHLAECLTHSANFRNKHTEIC